MIIDYDKMKQEILESTNLIIDKHIKSYIDHIKEIEMNYLNVGNTKILIVIPTKDPIQNTLPSNLDKLIIPSGHQCKFLNI